MKDTLGLCCGRWEDNEVLFESLDCAASVLCAFIVFSLCLCRVEEPRQYCVIVLAAQDQKYLDDDE